MQNSDMQNKMVAAWQPVIMFVLFRRRLFHWLATRMATKKDPAAEAAAAMSRRAKGKKPMKEFKMLGLIEQKYLVASRWKSKPYRGIDAKIAKWILVC